MTLKTLNALPGEAPNMCHPLQNHDPKNDNLTLKMTLKVLQQNTLHNVKDSVTLKAEQR